MPCGKLGCALLQQSTDQSSKVILYKTRDKILSTLLLSDAKTIYWKPPYLQYHDDFSVFWSLHFDSQKETQAFFDALKDKCNIDGLDEEKQAASDVTKEGENKKSGSTEEIVDAASQAEPTSKSKIVDRVAKVGHQLPVLFRTESPTLENKNHNNVSRRSSISDVAPNLLIASTPITAHLAKSPFVSVAVSPGDVDVDALTAEARMLNAEIRMSLMKMDSKLERVLDQVECLNLSCGRQQSDCVDKDDEVITLEEKLLALKKENRLLKLQLQEAERAKEDAKANVKSINPEALAVLEKKIVDKDKQIEEFQTKTAELERTVGEQKAAFEEATKKKNEVVDKQLTEIANLKAELATKESQLQAATEQNGQQLSGKGADALRSIMNQFYVQLFETINGKDELTASEVLKLTAEIIRKETRAALNQN